ncbi:hypothetical protein CsSME_00022746 [Camellia sinensis var. sinensis]
MENRVDINDEEEVPVVSHGSPHPIPPPLHHLSHQGPPHLLHLHRRKPPPPPPNPSPPLPSHHLHPPPLPRHPQLTTQRRILHGRTTPPSSAPQNRLRFS